MHEENKAPGAAETMPLVSVVVPVYNVEGYLRKCMASIVNQSYRNLEIILVDDGSTDGSGAICDELAKTDDRIIVLHKENGGLSDARNAGMELASGEFFGFVDSDDYLELEMYECLVFNALHYQAEISCCKAADEPENQPAALAKSAETAVLNSREALTDLFTQGRYLRHAAWNKIYRRELFDGICFPVGRLFEDAAIMYKLIERANRIVCADAELYHYLQRNGSISRARYRRESVMHRWENCLNAMQYFQKDPDLQDKVYWWCSFSVQKLWKEAHNAKDTAMMKKLYTEHCALTQLGRLWKLPVRMRVKNMAFLLLRGAYF